MMNLFRTFAAVETAILPSSWADAGDGEGIFNILGLILNILTVGFGAAAVVGILVTAYQYMTARDNPQAVAAAKERIMNIVIGVVIYAAFWGVINWLLPGGLFSGSN